MFFIMVVMLSMVKYNFCVDRLEILFLGRGVRSCGSFRIFVMDRDRVGVSRICFEVEFKVSIFFFF